MYINSSYFFNYMYNVFGILIINFKFMLKGKVVFDKYF